MVEKRKHTLTGLAARLGRLSADKRRVALEVSASLAGVSLRVSRTFVEAVPKAAKILSADDLREWGEMGRRLAMADAETGFQFFRNGVEGLSKVPKDARKLAFRLGIRQLVLSTSAAVETFRSIPSLANNIEDKQVLELTLKLAAEISNRSAKHSTDLLQSAVSVATALEKVDDPQNDVRTAIFGLGFLFASRTGGMTADLWAVLPKVISNLSADEIVFLVTKAEEILDHGASVTLYFLDSGGELFRRAPNVFADWLEVLESISGHGNAVLISFLRFTPVFLKNIPVSGGSFSEASNTLSDRQELIRKVFSLIAKVAEMDAASALSAFKTSSSALRSVDFAQFERWINAGLDRDHSDSPKAKRSYFALETKESNAYLLDSGQGLALDSVQGILRIYVEGLTGNEVEVSPLAAMSAESRIGDGKTIFLPSLIDEFEEDEENFRLYKVLAAYAAGQIEFGTFAENTVELRAVYSELAALYKATADQIDAFSLAGYIEDLTKGVPSRISMPPTDEDIVIPPDVDHKTVLRLFPEVRLARRIFGTMENARIDRRLHLLYKGLRIDLDLMRSMLKRSRPYIFDIPVHQVPFELLFQITLAGGATDDARQFYGQVISEIESVINSYLVMGNATVADSLLATSRVYTLFQSINEERIQEPDKDQEDDKNEYDFEDNEQTEPVIEDRSKKDLKAKRRQDIKDIFNAWNSLDEEGEPEDLHGAQAWTQSEMPEQPLEEGEEAFSYDEWDRELNDHRLGWSRVIEKRVKLGERSFVELTRSRYRGVISSIRRQFQLMKPENMVRVNREIDGEDYDLNALIDHVIDRKTGGTQTERFYTKRLRRERDVAVSILLDQSSSTARTITRNPLQPYTYPGRRIIEIEKEGLVLLSEALEAVGDVYSIYGFTSEGRRNVKFFVIKDFDEKYSDDVEKRIGGITFQNNTRLGAAIRHAASKLMHREARTKLLIVLTDGRPYDHDYGDAKYASEDVREALTEARISDVNSFCITIDRESEAELRGLYGDAGYTIIDDVLNLPERMPNIYRRLTS